MPSLRDSNSSPTTPQSPSLTTIPDERCRFINQFHNRGNLVVTVTDSWPACHEFKPSIVEDSPFTGSRSTLNMPRYNILPLVRILMRLVEELMDSKSVVTQSPQVGRVWKREVSACSGVILNI
ncbi:hypothetical protein TNCV_4751251 [Trichonephila clavipes]|nr:hypothetical protein TNCV_4751251 [Trichonephila clavipes]